MDQFRGKGSFWIKTEKNVLWSCGKKFINRGVTRRKTMEVVRRMDQFGREKGISIRKKQIIDFQFKFKFIAKIDIYDWR